MKNTKSIILVICVLLLNLTVIFSSSAEAGWWGSTKRGDLPQTILALDGVFKGEQKTEGTAYLLIYPMKEQWQPSGRANIFLLYGDKSIGQVFEGYMLGEYQMGLLPVGLDQTADFIEPKSAPTATLEIQPTKDGPIVVLKPYGASTVVAKTFEFDRMSDDLKLGPVLPNGFFSNESFSKSATDTVTSHPTTAESTSLNMNTPTIQLTGVFQTIFELTGLMVLRPQIISESMKQYGASQISGLAVSVIDDGRESLIVGLPNTNGSPAPVIFLRKK
ncbi:MAG: hypothetical protein ABL927_07600 [Bdellovibrionales bacterium]